MTYTGTLIRFCLRRPWWCFASIVAAAIGIINGLCHDLPLSHDIVVTPGLVPMFFSSCHLKRKARLLSRQEPIDRLNALDMALFAHRVISRLTLLGFTMVPSQAGSTQNLSMVKMIRNGDMYLLFLAQNALIKPGHIEDYIPVLLTEGIHKGIVVSTGIFSRKTRIYAEKMSLELIDGMDLLQLLGRLPDESHHPVPTDKTGGQGIHTLIQSMAPLCPLCDSVLSIRLGSKNGHHGKTCWTCRQSPTCRETYPYSMETVFPD